ncbi:MAG: hypothetical protein U1A25_02725 [Candidatus Sungbacteria bacterium]|nr:hypothetical protein [Candidatus Sungbacteria bacterium]
MLKNSIFLTVISGVLIFATQKIISELYIAPIIDFKKCLAKIETSMVRWSFLYKFEYKNNGLVGANGTMDEAIENFRKELNNLATELLGAYSSLPFLEKKWLQIKGIDISEAKSALLGLSVTIGSKGDWNTEESKAEKEIDRVYKYLRFEKK